MVVTAARDNTARGPATRHKAKGSTVRDLALADIVPGAVVAELMDHAAPIVIVMAGGRLRNDVDRHGRGLAGENHCRGARRRAGGAAPSTERVRAPGRGKGAPPVLALAVPAVTVPAVTAPVVPRGAAPVIPAVAVPAVTALSVPAEAASAVPAVTTLAAPDEVVLTVSAKSALARVRKMAKPRSDRTDVTSGHVGDSGRKVERKSKRPGEASAGRPRSEGISHGQNSGAAASS